MLASAYTTSSILQSEKAIDRQVELLCGWLNQYSVSSEPMHLSDYFSFAAYDVMGESCCEYYSSGDISIGRVVKT